MIANKIGSFLRHYVKAFPKRYQDKIATTVVSRAFGTTGVYKKCLDYIWVNNRDIKQAK